MKKIAIFITFVLISMETICGATLDKALSVKRFNDPLKSGKSYYAMVFRNGFQSPLSTCKATRYMQTIKDPDCLPLTIPNKYCGGSCASYFIPVRRSGASNDVNGIFEDCRQCEPESYQVVRVLMLCPKINIGFKLKKVVLINKCRCRGIKCTLIKR